MSLLARSRGGRPRAKTIQPAERYLTRGAEEARGRGHNFVGTEHVLLAVIGDRDGSATRLLGRLSVTPAAVEVALACWLPAARTAPIDAEALAALGIDLEAVRERLEQSFGPGALEQTRTGCLGIAPRLKLALAYALDLADGGPLSDEHVLLGLLKVPDSVAAHVLTGLGVSLEAASAATDAS